MATLTDADLTRIAAALSGEHGTFPVSNLVNYGSTVMVRPGARTTHGIVLSGAEVSARLAGDYVAFPLSVEYMAEPEGEMEAQLAGLEADALGAVSGRAPGLRLRGRYARVIERFRFLLGQVRRGIRGDARFRANKALARLTKIWVRMGTQGVNRQGLVPPGRLRAELAGLRAIPRPQLRPSAPVPVATTNFPASSPVAVAPAAVMPTYAPAAVVLPPVAPMAPVATVMRSTYVPASRVVSRYYQADQEELEREVAEGAPSYYGASDYAVGQEELGADLRADTIGYLFGGAEHDYYGMDASEDIEFTSSDFRTLLDDRMGDALVDFAEDDLHRNPRFVELLDGALESARLGAEAQGHGLVDPALARRLRKKAKRIHRAVRLGALGADEDAEADAVIEDEEAVIEDEEATAVVKPAALDAVQSKAANLQRRVLLPSASELRSVKEGKDGLEKAARAAKLITQLTDALRSVSPSGSVNYTRLRPRSFGGEGPAVTVIGIQRTSGKPDSLLDVLYEEEVPRFPVGYDVPDAVEAITRYTSISDYLGSDSGSANLLLALMSPVEEAVYGPVLYGGEGAWPNGTGAPLPPPRRLGAEVYGA